MLDSAFLSRIDDLKVPVMGTDIMGPLLYTLVRFTRPSSVLEVGAGYTSLFLLKGLADNDAEREKLAKVAAWLTDHHGDEPDRMHELAARSMPLIRFEFLSDESPTGQLTIIDSLASRSSTARFTPRVARALGYEGRLINHNSDFRDCVEDLREQHGPFDLVWFDCGNHEDGRDFVSLYWDLVKPDGGLLLLHSLLTNVSCRELLEELTQRHQKTGPDEFEILSLLEPHKFAQNSVTLVRRTSEFVAPNYTREVKRDKVIGQDFGL